MDSNIIAATHASLLETSTLLAARHPDSAGAYLAAPWCLYVLAIAWTTLWLRAKIVAAYARISGVFPREMQAQMQQQPQPDDELRLPDGTPLRPVYARDGSVDSYEPMRTSGRPPRITGLRAH